MAGWVGPVIALSVVVIAAAVSFVAVMIFAALREAQHRTATLAREVAQLRLELAPTLEAVKNFGESGAEVAQMAREEAREIIDTTRRVRYDIERGVKRAKRRLADLDAVVEVAQQEVDAVVVDVATALETARSGAGMISQLRRLIRPRRRGAA
ncbi:MAG TPA: hypothetical protein VGL65_08480 [Gemmatimonadales bacterium]|jgi:phage-related tail protein